MLRDAPRRRRTVGPGHGKPGPAVRVHEPGEHRCVAPVGFAHARVVAVEERAVGGELRPHALVLGDQREKCFAHVPRPNHRSDTPARGL